MATVTVNDAALAELVAAGAQELIERGRREERARVSAQAHLESAMTSQIDAGHPIAMQDIERVRPAWVLRTAVRLAMHENESVRVYAQSSRAFGCVLTDLAAPELDKLNTLVMSIMAARQDRLIKHG